MSNFIHIDPDLLRDVATNLQGTIDALDVVDRAMSKIHGEMPDAWRSAYTDVYLEKMEDVRKKVFKTKTEIENIQSGLRGTARRAEELEKQQTQILTSKSSSE